MTHSSASYTEALLHDIWREQHLFLVREPILSDGTRITILTSGVHNTERGGPDFRNARLLIDNFLIEGDIEIHRKPADWHSHHHTGDSHYARVVLHIVLDDDTNASRPKVPTLILRDNFDFRPTEYWKTLFKKHYARAPELFCFPHNLSVPMRKKLTLVRTMSMLRLNELVQRYEHAQHDHLIDKVYERVLDALGFSQNRAPMRTLASALPRSLLKDIRQNEPPLQLGLMFEALYMTTAGLLDETHKDYDSETNEYLLELHSLYHLLSTRYALPSPMVKDDWSFYKIRQMNSPYRRVAAAAGLAELYFSRNNLSLSEEYTIDHKDSYWNRRSSYIHILPKPYSLIGKERLIGIKSNVLYPARIAETISPKIQDQLRSEWYRIPSRSSAHSNSIISQELLESEPIRTVEQEQGALLLYRQYCSVQRCSECPLGKELLERNMMSM